MTELFSVAHIRAIETRAQETLPAGTLMRRAGVATAELAEKLIDRQPRNLPILILAGPGNNGGDALEAAFHLNQEGLRVQVWLVGPGSQQESYTGTPEYERALARARIANIPMVPYRSVNEVQGNPWSMVIDGLFGIGLKGTLKPDVAMLLDAVNQLDCIRLAIDVPTGIDCDTGAQLSEHAFEATHTITFLADKPGLHTGAGIEHAGQITVESLAVSPYLRPSPAGYQITPSLFCGFLKARRKNTHKGTFGSVLTIGGAPGMTGASLMAARCAAHAGAGKVFAGLVDHSPQNMPALDWQHPELMIRLVDAETSFDDAVIVAGCGMGQSAAAHDILMRVLAHPAPIVLDADALNLIAENRPLQQLLAQRRTPALLTPHPLEAARLLDSDVATVQKNRIVAAEELAFRFNATVILKGAGSIVAAPENPLLINPTGNPALATAGTGDVLAGFCGALLAQGWNTSAAAAGAVWMHGAAADQLVIEGVGPVGLTASELIPAIRTQHNLLISNAASLKEHDGSEVVTLFDNKDRERDGAVSSRLHSHSNMVRLRS